MSLTSAFNRVGPSRAVALGLIAALSYLMVSGVAFMSPHPKDLGTPSQTLPHLQTAALNNLENANRAFLEGGEVPCLVRNPQNDVNIVYREYGSEAAMWVSIFSHLTEQPTTDHTVGSLPGYTTQDRNAVSAENCGTVAEVAQAYQTTFKDVTVQMSTLNPNASGYLDVEVISSSQAESPAP